jgi:hypothetical protein
MRILRMMALLLVTTGVVWAARQQQGKAVHVTNFPSSLAVSVQNFPATQPVSFPAAQPVQVQNFPEAPLAATRPSQLVTIRSTGALCGTSPWRALDQQVNQDGTLSAFVVPAGKVLVVTSVDWRQGSTGSPGKQEEFFLFPSAANIDVNYAVVDSMSLGSSDGRAGTSIVVTGVAIKAGTPCWGVNSLGMGTADALVHGFLADDR